MRALLADGHKQVRSALRLLLEHQTEISVVGEVAEAEGLLARVRIDLPDLVLLDWELPSARHETAGLGGYGLVTALRNLNPAIRVVALSGRPEARHAALAAGADAFVCKGDPPELVLAALRRREPQGDASAA